eukprot:m.13918 g.13918  ORF g.13918 m.13918 type:complete len:779 (+) comp4953_c0_seq2:339-2675(+)
MMNIIIAITTVLSASSSAVPLGDVNVYVSAQSGADNAPGSFQYPLQTLFAAREKARELRGNSTALTATIWLFPGVYGVNSTLNLTEVDSNTIWRPVNNTAPLPLISGGVPLQWTESASKTPYKGPTCTILTARDVLAPRTSSPGIKGMQYPQLYIDGTRASIARSPNNGLSDPSSFFEWLPVRGATANNITFAYNSSQVNPTAWVNATSGDILQDVTLLIGIAPWTLAPRRLQAIDTQHGTITLTDGVHTRFTSQAFLGVKRLIALNTQDGSLSPGSYRYNSASRTITYNYCTNNTAEISSLPKAYVPTPGLETIVRFTGEVSNVTFLSVKFAHSAVGNNPSSYSYGPAETGAVEVGENASSISFMGVGVSCTGNNGIQLRHGVKNVLIQGCSFTEIGGRGFTTTLESTGAVQDATDITITDNIFNGCGQTFIQQPFCVFVSGKSGINVLHNDISNVPYSGIRVWAFNKPSEKFNEGVPVFNISFNHVHHVGLGLLSDFGAIFVTSRPGSGADCIGSYGEQRCQVAVLVTNNVIHTVRHFDHSGIGIYTDESSSLTNITKNLVFDCGSWGLHLHCGDKHVVRNNIFAGNAAQQPVALETYSLRSNYAVEPFCNFGAHNDSIQGTVMTRNVFDQAITSAAGVGRAVSILNNVTGANTVYGNINNTVINVSSFSNLYSCVSGSDCKGNFPNARSFQEWQQQTNEDVGSCTGNPGFSKGFSARRDYRIQLNQSQCASKIRFEEISFDNVGPRKELLSPIVGVCNNNGGSESVWWQGCVSLI